ncbi:MAG: hypothetical protein JWQ09_2972 [Segetibacter sp.]|nr:hypothetical protein [Segetibacter sp.]
MQEGNLECGSVNEETNENKLSKLDDYVAVRTLCQTYTNLLNDNEEEFIFEPLALFELAEKEADFIVANKTQPPVHLRQHLDKATDNFTPKQIYFFTSTLGKFLQIKITTTAFTDGPLPAKASTWQTEEMTEWLLNVIDHWFKKAFPERVEKIDYVDFSKLKEESEKLGDVKSQMIFWHNQIAEYKQFGFDYKYRSEGNRKITFAKKCEIEIERLTAINEIEKASPDTLIDDEKVELSLPNISNKLVLLDQLGIIKYLQDKFPDQLNNRKVNLISLLELILQIPADNKAAFAANVKNLINGSDNSPLNPTSLQRVRVELLKIGISI